MLPLLTVSQNYMKSHTDSMWSVRTVRYEELLAFIIASI